MQRRHRLHLREQRSSEEILFKTRAKTFLNFFKFENGAKERERRTLCGAFTANTFFFKNIFFEIQKVIKSEDETNRRCSATAPTPEKRYFVISPESSVEVGTKNEI